jgi:hypothetical protein
MTISNGRLVENRMERKKSAASGFVSLGFSGQGHDLTAPGWFGQPRAWRDQRYPAQGCASRCARSEGMRPASKELRSISSLLVEHNVEERAVNFQTAAVVINETELSETIHKEVHSRSRGADHFCQGFLAYLRNYIF